MKRVSLGIPGLDQMTGGGLIAGRPYILSGVQGSGKTILAMRFLLRGIEENENGLYVALDEPPNELHRNFKSLRWNIGKIRVLDAVPEVRGLEKTPVKDVAISREIRSMDEMGRGVRKTADFKNVEMTFNAFLQNLKHEVYTRNYGRIVIDSITSLKLFFLREHEQRSGVQSLLRFLSELRITSLVTSCLPEVTGFQSEIFLSRGEIRLHKRLVDGEMARSISVKSLRGSAHDSREHPFSITSHGFIVDVKSKEEGAQEPEPEESAEPDATKEDDMRRNINRLILIVTEDIKDCLAIGTRVNDIQALTSLALSCMTKGDLELANTYAVQAKELLDQRISFHYEIEEMKRKQKSLAEELRVQAGLAMKIAKQASEKVSVSPEFGGDYIASETALPEEEEELANKSGAAKITEPVKDIDQAAQTEDEAAAIKEETKEIKEGTKEVKTDLPQERTIEGHKSKKKGKKRRGGGNE